MTTKTNTKTQMIQWCIQQKVSPSATLNVEQQKFINDSGWVCKEANITGTDYFQCSHDVSCSGSVVDYSDFIIFTTDILEYIYQGHTDD